MLTELTPELSGCCGQHVGGLPVFYCGCVFASGLAGNGHYCLLRGALVSGCCRGDFAALRRELLLPAKLPANVSPALCKTEPSAEPWSNDFLT